ncbi:hypothetical protein [Lysobacter gummosus]
MESMKCCDRAGCCYRRAFAVAPFEQGGERPRSGRGGFALLLYLGKGKSP